MPPFIAPKTEVKVKELRSNSSTHSFSLQSKTFLNCNHVVVRQGKYLKYYSYFDPIWSLDQYLGQNLPSYLPSYKEDNPVLPSCDSVKVEIVVHEGTIKIPFVAHLTSGNSKWSVPKVVTICCPFTITHQGGGRRVYRHRCHYDQDGTFRGKH